MKQYVLTFQTGTQAKKFSTIFDVVKIEKNVVTVKLLYNPSSLESNFMKHYGITNIEQS